MIAEELNEIIEMAEMQMQEAIVYTQREFGSIRAGKASPSLLDTVRVEYYGAQTPLNQLANISAPEPRLLTVEPFDKSSINDIEKAILSSPLGLNPNNDGIIIRIPLPILSEERRKQLVKMAKDVTEHSRVSIRNARRDANDSIKKKVKEDSLPEDSRFEAEDIVQEKTNHYIAEIDKILAKKEKEILTV